MQDGPRHTRFEEDLSDASPLKCTEVQSPPDRDEVAVGGSLARLSSKHSASFSQLPGPNLRGSWNCQEHQSIDNSTISIPEISGPLELRELCAELTRFGPGPRRSYDLIGSSTSSRLDRVEF